MITVNRTIAQKYAQALLNNYDAAFTDQSIEQLKKFQQFLLTNKSFFAYLSIPSISESTKQIAIEKITIHFKVPFLTTLLMLLLKHKRITLLPLVINQSIKTHQSNHHITHFTINTSHALQETEKQHIINFIHQVLGQKKILTLFCVEPKLISGLRIKSNDMIWERSIKKVLQQIKQSLFERVGL